MSILQSDDVARSADIEQIYRILLGRRPESLQVAEAQAGATLTETIRNFMISDEFADVAADLQRGTLSRHPNLARQELVRARAWVGRVTGTALPWTASWWAVLRALLCAPQVAAIVADLQFTEVAASVGDGAEAEAERSSAIAPYLLFDETWLKRRYMQPTLGAEPGMTIGADLVSDAIRHDRALLPFFTEGLADTYGFLRKKATLDLTEVIEETIAAIERGAVTHWLFHREIYIDTLRWQDDLIRPTGEVTPANAYLDFLTYGAAQDYAPHPLFCAYAYRNARGSIARGRTAFADYILDGCFANVPTSRLFDEAFYVAMNPSVEMAVLSGHYINPLHHFIVNGIYRDLAFSPDFDLAHYRAQNDDVVRAVAEGALPSLSWHYLYLGLAEGRQPNPYFNSDYYLSRHPTAGSEMRRLNIRTALEHFLLLGKDRGYKADRPLTTTEPAIYAAKAVFQRRARRSLANLRRAPLDFTPFTQDVALSIIVPVYDEIEFTSLFLECAYFAASHFRTVTGKGCEVVIVDNGSTDGTPALLRSCPGLKVRSFDRPIGFPRAVNAGAEIATGATVIVANNDIQFMPDALLRVHQRLAADEKIGLVGGLTILPNETLQEAGSFLTALGSVAGLGRGENPWDAYFQGLHRADYCTGSFIGFRRADFEALGGLDEAFSPGYYEETDFTFRMREQLGKQAVVDGDLQVVHFEHASFGKGRPPTTAQALIRRNQGRFARRHSAALATRPSPARLAGPEGVRPRAIGRVRMLVIEDLVPDPRLGSGFVRVGQLLQRLSAQGIAYDLLVRDPSIIVDDYVDPLVTVYRAWMPGEDVATVLERKAARYSHIMVCRTHNLALYAHFLEAARAEHGIEIICDTEALTALRLLEMRRVADLPIDPLDPQVAVRTELEAPVRVAHWIAVSPRERAFIEGAGLGPVSVICQDFGAPEPDPRGWADRHRILAVGAVHETGVPNHDGLIWFMEQVWPRLSQDGDPLTLTIAGFWKSGILEAFRARYPDSRIDYQGVVSPDELRTLYGESRMAIAPTRFAAGVACKVLEAIVEGVPIVITDLLEDQLLPPDAPKPTGLAAGSRFDDGRSFAEWVDRLRTDEAAWDAVRRRQMEVAEPLAGAAAFDAGIASLIEAAGLRSEPHVEAAVAQA